MNIGDIVKITIHPMPGQGFEPRHYIARLTDDIMAKQKALCPIPNIPGSMVFSDATTQEKEAWWHISEREGVNMIHLMHINHFINITHGKHHETSV